VRAARAIAARHGLPSPRPRLLSDCNNTIVHLVPWPVVAKVADTSTRPGAAGRLQRELDVARHLASSGAAVAAPSPELPVEPHRHSCQVATFWRFQEHDPAAPADGRAAARSLRELHRALATFAGELPPFRPLPDPRRLSVPQPERSFLLAEHARLTAELRGRAWASRPLHGDPHRGNLLATRDGCRWIDFESACLGPLEWDLSALPAGDASAWPGADRSLLTLLRQVRSFRTVLWCRTRAGSGPEVERAAAAHLALLRERAA
jgi:Ser/Thr protein kinase RdoA (MazF antagonist)